MGVGCLLLPSIPDFIPNTVSWVLDWLGHGAAWPFEGIFFEEELGLQKDQLRWKAALLFCDLAWF